MTAYQGGKLRLGRRIHEIINRIETDLGKEQLTYMEPFCGMCGVLQHVAKYNTEREIIASDINCHVIEMWKSLQNGWIPPNTFSREEFDELKTQTEASAIKGFTGSVACYGNVFMSFYRLHLVSTGRDFIMEAKRSVLKVYENVKNSKFSYGSYEDASPDGKVIYCDPPYIKNGFKTQLFREFDHETFWETMRTWSCESLVFISERVAPSDFICVWAHDFKASINKKKSTCIREKLFIHESWYSQLSPDVKNSVIGVD